MNGKHPRDEDKHEREGHQDYTRPKEWIVAESSTAQRKSHACISLRVVTDANVVRKYVTPPSPLTMCGDTFVTLVHRDSSRNTNTPTSREPGPPRDSPINDSDSQRSVNGAASISSPTRPLARFRGSGHEFVYVVVVAVLDAGAAPSRPRGPQVVAHPSLGEVRHLDAIGEHT